MLFMEDNVGRFKLIRLPAQGERPVRLIVVRCAYKGGIVYPMFFTMNTIFVFGFTSDCTVGELTMFFVRFFPATRVGPALSFGCRLCLSFVFVFNPSVFSYDK